MKKKSWLTDWSPEQFQVLEKSVLVAKHRLHESGLFSHENLIRIIERHPAHLTGVSTMSRDTSRTEWRDGDHQSVTADQLLEATRTGRLWINVRRVLDHHVELRDAINSIYDELEAECSGFQAKRRTANLLISSPHVMVPYHVDAPVNMLWHISGKKRVWVYPPFDPRFAPQNVIEDFVSGEISEDIPYDESFDQYALVFDVEPGQMITWPQNTPHRVTNTDGLNVSLSTEHQNAVATRRLNVYQANRLLRQTLGWSHASADPSTPSAHLKQSMMRFVRMVRRCSRQAEKTFEHPVTFRVDPEAPDGYRLLETGIR